MAVKDLVRPNIVAMAPYSSARSEFSGEGKVFLDANEYPSPLIGELNRYPDPFQKEVKEMVTQLQSFQGINWDQLFLGNGSDEAIDLLYRIFCTPKEDRVVIMPPTYGVYKVFASLNDVHCSEVPLTEDFSLNMDSLKSEIVGAKILWICSPNNPTGGVIPLEDIEELLSFYTGIVVVDEAYIDFADASSAITLLPRYKNLVILRTFSKAWGLAGARIGVAIGSSEIIGYFNKVKYPYNLGNHTQDLLAQAITKESEVIQRVDHIKQERSWLIEELTKIPTVKEITPSEANFILVRMEDGKSAYQYLLDQGVVVRYRGNEVHCKNTIRITIGTKDENRAVVEALRAYKNTK